MGKTGCKAHRKARKGNNEWANACLFAQACGTNTCQPKMNGLFSIALGRRDP